MNEYLRAKIKVVSFFLVTLVVIVHAYNTNIQPDPEILHHISGINAFIQEFVCQGIGRIASPLFFIISGYLFFVNIDGRVKDFLRKLKKRFFTLIVPYLFWSLWGLLVYVVLQAVLPPDITFSKGIIMQYDLGRLLNTIFLDPIPYQLWYVRDLTVFALFSPLIYLLLKYLRVFIVLIFLFTWLYDFDFVIFRNQSMIFFVFGAYISHKDVDLINRPHRWAAIIFTSLWMILTFIKTGLVYIEYPDVIMLTLMHKVSIAVGVLSVNNVYNVLFRTSDEIVQTRFFKIVSFSFFLFAAHEPVTTIFKKGLFWMFGNSELKSFGYFMITPLLSIVLCVFIGYHLKRLAPKFYGTITGWR